MQLHSKFQKEIFRPWILASFFWLILIVLLGVTMRISLVMGIQLPTSFSFARHAHSHTAFWGWAGPAMFGFILATCVDDINRNPKWEKILFLSNQILTLFSIVSFILGGYSSYSILSSSLMVLVWLGFVVYYFRSTKETSGSFNPYAAQMVRVSIWMLVLSTLPTFLIPMSILSGIERETIKTILIHFFLEMFSEGWLYGMSLAILIFLRKGSLIESIQFPKFRLVTKLSIPIILFLSFRSTYLLFPNYLQWLILGSSFFWGVLQIFVGSIFLRKERSLAYVSIAILILGKGVLDALFVIPNFRELIVIKSITILYMHWKLLGVVSILIVVTAQKNILPKNRLISFLFYSFLVGMLFTLIAMVFIFIPDMRISGWNDSSFWKFGQTLAAIAGIFIWMSAVGFYVQLLYSSR